MNNFHFWEEIIQGSCSTRVYPIWNPDGTRSASPFLMAQAPTGPADVLELGHFICMGEGIVENIRLLRDPKRDARGPRDPMGPSTSVRGENSGNFYARGHAPFLESPVMPVKPLPVNPSSSS